MAVDFSNPQQVSAFRSHMISQGINKSQLSQLDNFLQGRQKEQLVRQGVIDLADIAESDPAAALRLANEGIRPGVGATADERKLQAKKSGLDKSIAILEKNLLEAGPFGRGAVGGPLGAIIGNVTGGALAPESADFEALRKSMIGPVARIISQEAGVLTDRDIERAENLLPRLRDDPGLSQRKLDNLRELLGDTGSGGGQATQAGRFTIEKIE